MTPGWSRTVRIAAVLLVLLIAIGVAVPLLGVPGGFENVSSKRRRVVDFDPRTAPPPWDRRCPVTITAYEDGSASLYCGNRRRSFARIDAETDRIRMRAPR
jgi:hypothetical protein